MSGTDFFPVDYLSAKESFDHSDLADVLEAQNSRLTFLTGYIKNKKLAELVNALAEEDDVKWRLRTALSKLNTKYFLEKNDHEADLAWAVTELKSILAHWGEATSPALSAGVEQKVQQLQAKLEKKIEELG